MQISTRFLTASLLPLFMCSCAEEDPLGAVRAKILVSPGALDFGRVPQGAVKYVSVELASVGTKTLTIKSVSIGAPFEVALEPTELPTELPTEFPIELPPGAKRTFDVAFRPIALGDVRDALVISSDDPENPDLGISTIGRVDAGFVEVRPTLIDWTGTTLGTRRSLRLLITNMGPAVSGALQLLDFERPEHFDLAPVADLPALSSALADFDYQPYAGGADRGRVFFEFCGERCGVEARVIASAISDVVRIEPPLLDFGAVALRKTVHGSVRVHNDGSEPLMLQAIRIEHTSAAVPAFVSALPASIAPSASIEIGVDYTPPAAEELAGELVFTFARDDMPELRAPLIGRGEGPLFSVHPEVISFGSSAGRMARRTVLMVNEGSTPLEVRSLELSGNAAFAISGRPALPAMLGRGESLTAYVSFSAEALGDYDGTLSVGSSDEEHALIAVPVIATIADIPCDLEVPESVEFGIVQFHARSDQPLVVRNVGFGSCTLSGGTFALGGEPIFSAVDVSWPRTLAPDEELRLNMRFDPTSEGEARTTYTLTTLEAPERPFNVELFGYFGNICDGTTDDCLCPPGQVRAYRRFDDPAVPSGILSPDEVVPLHVYCTPLTCDPGEVAVETEANVYACVPAPAACTGGTVLDYRYGALECVPCEIIVRFGGIFGGERVCTDVPENNCPSGQVPTFEIETRMWECDATCDNGLYDRQLIDGALVCVPC